MADSRLTNNVRSHRERLGLSQLELADRVGVSRQAIVGIEGGKQVPATTLSLRLARALRCGVEELFRLAGPEGVPVRLAPDGAPSLPVPVSVGSRVTVAEMEDAWVAHGLPADGTVTADGIVSSLGPSRRVVVDLLTDPALLRSNVLISGCAPILGMLAQRVGTRFGDARATWLPGGSSRSLDLLESGLVHVAGVHLSSAAVGDGHEAIVRQRFPDEPMLIVNLTRWREGFVVPEGNPMGIRGAGDLLREGLRFAGREEGAAARRIVEALLEDAGAPGAPLTGPEAAGHIEVAQLVRSGAADVGVAIESVALAAGLGFVPLTEERFDLVVPTRLADGTPVARLIQALDDASFRVEMAHLPGYDSGLSGHVTTLEAA